MTSSKIENYAVANGLSNNAAKRRLRAKGDRSDAPGYAAPPRGVPVPGTGKPKGASK